MIVEAVYTSVWDDDVEIDSNCKVNLDTREVFDIEMIDVEEYDVDSCTGEYITLADGSKYGVYHKGNAEENDYWYE